ncbi:hypothetical protein DEU56DRAFT_806572 [Suillus clintonianus]|uniref:uncharacterized protein n=1 Tax=Suillus clintonianus TaxID=1904413 RepID=UPI001B875454|nr:uncharacterized protein DEU56DRAFT_806572 [Suillus clintonianus]KAG2135799.1 hypothetical protein DEU56DRAFT_806572 [Suillus clintonianus]
MQCTGVEESRPWVITVIRAQGYQPLRPEKSWRPIVSVVVDEHQRYEVNLGCDGQNPNLRERFMMRGTDVGSRVDINVYHQAPSKKKRKKRYLLATTSLSFQALSKLKGTANPFKIPLSSVVRPSMRGSARGRTVSVSLVAKLEVPQTEARLNALDSLASDDQYDDNIMSLGSPTSEPESDRTSNFPCSSRAITPPVSLDLSGIRIRRGYFSDTDDDRPLDDHVKLINDSYDSSEFTDNIDLSAVVLINNTQLVPLAPSLLPRYTEQISVDSSLSFIDALVDSFSCYAELRVACSDCSDSEYERILEKLTSEWYFVGASLVALSGLDAAVFGFSSSSLFSVNNFAQSSIAIGSVASGIGLAIDGWFLLVYSGANAKKFQKLARDVYGKYLFFCISSRLPAVCMFVSACALMAFLIAVAWSAWPTAVLVMCFTAGILISLQFIIYGLHCVVVWVTEVIRRVRRGLMWCVRRPSNDVSEHNVSEK